MTESFLNSQLSKIIYGSKRDAILYLRQKGVLKNTLRCNVCLSEMIETRKDNSADGYVFKCYNKHCEKHKTTKSIRCESFLCQFNIDLRKFIHFIYLYSKERLQKQIIEDVGVGKTLCGKICEKLRANCTAFLTRNPIIIGGPGVIINIDESKFNFNVKSHRGRSPTAAIWVFGMVDTSFSPSRGVMQVVENRSRDILIPIIQSHVRPQSIIYSDEWSAYANLSDYDYIHGTVCHKYHFKNPETGVHTQYVESYWNRQKNRIKAMLGVKKEVLSTYLDEFMFRDLFKENLYEKIFEVLLN